MPRAKLAGHDVTVLTEHVRDPEVLARRLEGIEALVLVARARIVGGANSTVQ